MTKNFSIFSGLALTLVGVGVFAFSMPAQAGFELVSPTASVGAAPTAPEAYAPEPVTALPVDLPPPSVDRSFVPADVPMEAPVVMPAPVSSRNNAPLVITSRPSDRPAQTQERKMAVYPPPGNAPAAPLSGSHVIPPTKSFATAPSGIAAPVVPTASSVINWNSQVTSRVEPVTTAPVDAGVVAPIRNVPAPAAPMADSFAVLSGFGSDIPFDLALDQVVPKDYRVIYQDRPERSMLVSWSGGRTWDAVLDDMLAAHGYRAEISGRTVTIARAGGGKLSQAAGAAAEVVPSAGAVALADPMLPPVPPQGALNDVALVPDLPDETPVTHAFDGGKKDHFRAVAGDDLQDVLTTWSNRAGVKLYWQAGQSYTLQNDITLDTTYPRAVDTLLKSFRDDPARPVASLHPNAPKGPAVLSVAAQQE